MNSDPVIQAVREAIVRAKAEVLTLTPDEVPLTAVLSDPPLAFDSIDFVSMVIELEELLGLIAEDEHFVSLSMQTVGDVVTAVQSWMASDAGSWG